MTVILQGDERLARAMTRGAADLLDLSDIHRQAARRISSTASADAPRRTGRLASSLRETASAREGRVTSSLPYAAPIHWGWPARNIEPQTFLSDAGTSTEPQWLAYYMTELDRIVSDCAGGP